MAGRPSGAPTAERTQGRRLQSILFLVALFAIAAGTVVGFFGARRWESRDAEEETAGIAVAAANSTATIIGRAVDTLGGASALLTGDGSLDLVAFQAFAADLAANGDVGLVALVSVVPAEGRTAFEAAVAPITALGTDNRQGPAPSSDFYYPVLAVAQAEAVEGVADASSLIGFDYRSDPARGLAAEAAVARGVTVVTQPAPLPASDQDGIVLLHPLIPGGAGDAEVVGFVATAVPIANLVGALAAALPEGTEFVIRDGAQLVAAVGEPGGPYVQAMEVELPGRTWELTVERPVIVGPSVPTIALVTGLGIWLGVFSLYIVTVRHQRRLRRVNESLAVAEHRSRTLERLASLLSRSLSGAEVGGALLESLHGLTGATGGAVSVLSADGGQLELVAASGYDQSQEGQLARVPLRADSAVAAAMATGQVAYLPSPLMWREDPTLARFADIGNAAAVVPLVDEDDVRGVLVVSQPSVRRFSSDERSLLVTIGALAGRALARSLRYDVEHATAIAFQQASLPAALPATEGAAVAARYRPATSSAAVGGDWYDVFSLADGRIALVVGDVVGHGMTAAAAMGNLRSSVRVLASVMPEPTALLRYLNVEIASIPDGFGATMAYGVIDVPSGRFDYVRAGHLPPLVLRFEGGAELPDGEPWPPLGVTPQSEPGTHTVVLSAGDTVVLYTDGVIERRGESLSVGLERLSAAGAALGDLDPDDLCDALLEAIVPSDDQADDVAILAIRMLEVPASRPDDLPLPTAALPNP